MPRRPYSSERELFREMLKRARIDAGLTQDVLSARLGRPQSYVSDYELGQRKLDWVDVDEVLKACAIELSEFAARYSAAVADQKPSQIKKSARTHDK